MGTWSLAGSPSDCSVEDGEPSRRPGEDKVHGRIGKVQDREITAAAGPQQQTTVKKRTTRDWDLQVCDHDCLLVWQKPMSNRNFGSCPTELPGRSLLQRLLQTKAGSMVSASCAALVTGCYKPSLSMQPVKQICMHSCTFLHEEANLWH